MVNAVGSVLPLINAPSVYLISNLQSIVPIGAYGA